MYLVDRDLKSRLPVFDFRTDGTVDVFDPNAQIGPCSIDLRMSGVYWKPTRRLRKRGLSLDRTQLMELSSRRGWKRYEAARGDSIPLGSGEMVLARTAECFRMPSDCAGAIEGRSSYARLGLEVHLAGGFINPGWGGHMPLSLVNHGSARLLIPVGTPVCQLMVISLGDEPDQDYAARSSGKYVNDDGGPSYWWRDVLFARLLDRTGLDARALGQIDDLLPRPNESILGRLDDFLADRPARQFGNPDELLDAFAATERRRSRVHGIQHFAAQWLSWSIGSGLGLFAVGHTSLTWRVGGIGVFLASLGPLAWHLISDSKDEQFLTPSHLDALRAARP